MHEFANIVLYFKVCSFLLSTEIKKKRPGLPHLCICLDTGPVFYEAMYDYGLPALVSSYPKSSQNSENEIIFKLYVNTTKNISIYTCALMCACTYIPFSPLKKITGSKARTRNLLPFTVSIRPNDIT